MALRNQNLLKQILLKQVSAMLHESSFSIIYFICIINKQLMHNLKVVCYSF